MSVTGHGAKTGHVRHADDFYATPSWATRAILPHLAHLNSGPVLDPCCGDGAILDVIASEWPRSPRLGIEIDDVRWAQAHARHPLTSRGDALAGGWAPAALILTNPPFGLAMEFVQRANATGAVVAMLLRLNWLASQKRADWLRRNTPSVYVLPKRPSFTGGGTDATDYFWALWDGNPPTVRILEIES